MANPYLTSSELEIFLFLNRGMWILNQFFSLELNFDYHAVRKPRRSPCIRDFCDENIFVMLLYKDKLFWNWLFHNQENIWYFFQMYCLAWNCSVCNPKSLKKVLQNVFEIMKKKSFHGQLSHLRIFWENRNKVANTGAPVLQKALGSILDFSFCFFKFRKVAKRDVRISIVYWKILMF